MVTFLFGMSQESLKNRADIFYSRQKSFLQSNLAETTLKKKAKEEMVGEVVPLQSACEPGKLNCSFVGKYPLNAKKEMPRERAPALCCFAAKV